MPRADGPFVQLFEVDGKALGMGLRGWDRLDGKLHPPASIAVACPLCGCVWAKCPVSLTGGKPNRYQFLIKACRDCPTPSDRGQGIYGSLYDASFDPDFIDAFPPEVWQREVQHYLSLYPDTQQEEPQ